MTELYALNVKDNREFIMSDAAAAMVSGERLARSRAFRHLSDFLLSMGGELLCRALIRDKLKLRNGEINFARTHYGKPFLAGREGFFFNVSHSGDIVLCAIAGREIGCDCELISAGNKIEDIDIVYAPGELEKIRKLHGPEKTAFCHRVWALKESYLKCAGIGLNEEPRTLETFLDDADGPPSIARNGRKLDVSLKLYDAIEGYAAAICLAGNDFKRPDGGKSEARAGEQIPDTIKFADTGFLTGF